MSTKLQQAYESWLKRTKQDGDPGLIGYEISYALQVEALTGIDTHMTLDALVNGWELVPTTTDRSPDFDDSRPF